MSLFPFVSFHWMAPDDGWLQLNLDSSHWHHNNRISCGGAFRDSCGNWVLGFAKNIGYGFTLKAELIGALTGLKVAWENNMKNILVEMDSQIAINNIEEGNNGAFQWDPILAYGACTLVYRKPPSSCIDTLQEEASMIKALVAL
ncbi:ribonuclease H [Senna tora]|uniref:Ribonuclease H n=1 Tax=Senna tora TaxID=362788 RepID=A0A834T9H4_9FABA|nr:ribonuclease H [Senna tora]